MVVSCDDAIELMSDGVVALSGGGGDVVDGIGEVKRAKVCGCSFFLDVVGIIYFPS